MKTFREWLTEGIQFAMANDDDYTSSPRRIVFFDKNDKNTYKKSGKTHGLKSHSIKHFGELDLAKYQALGDKVKSIVKKIYDEGKLEYIELHDKSGKTITTDPVEVFEKAKYGEWLNALDNLNDKIENKQPTNNVEEALKPVLNEIGNLYLSVIKKTIKSAVDLDNMKEKTEIYDAISKSRFITFSGKEKGIAKRNFYLGLKIGSLIIAQGEKIFTCFVMNGAKTPTDTIKAFLRKKPDVFFTNTVVDEVFNNL